MQNSVHHISKRLTIEETWTDDPVPQLKYARINSLGDREGSAVIDPKDIHMAVVRLGMINLDWYAQMRLTRRLKGTKA